MEKRIKELTGWDRHVEWLLQNSPSYPMSQYQKLWQRIRTSETPIKVRCPVSHQKTLIQAIRQYKAKVNVQRKALDLPAYGMLKVISSGDTLEFSLAYNGDQF